MIEDSAMHATHVTAVAARALRTALGQFATGVAVAATCDADGRPLGLTINSLGSVSLMPPLVLWSLGHTSRALAAFERAPHFALSVLSAAQIGLAEHFAHGVQPDAPWRDVRWRAGAGGSPVLDGALAWFECRSGPRHVAGDHTIFIGTVEACGCAQAAGAPLIFHGGRYYTELPRAAR